MLLYVFEFMVLYFSWQTELFAGLGRGVARRALGADPLPHQETTNPGSIRVPPKSSEIQGSTHLLRLPFLIYHCDTFCTHCQGCCSKSAVFRTVLNKVNQRTKRALYNFANKTPSQHSCKILILNLELSLCRYDKSNLSDFSDTDGRNLPEHQEVPVQPLHRPFQGTVCTSYLQIVQYLQAGMQIRFLYLKSKHFKQSSFIFLVSEFRFACYMQTKQ